MTIFPDKNSIILIQNFHPLYIFGGNNTGKDKKFDDIWSFSIVLRNWQKIEPKGDIIPEVSTHIIQKVQKRTLYAIL